ncbi:MAG: hypothetical protein JWL91_2338 [Sphingomonas bacterium]|nr:hypothetical protein [Sphingomonas bacterium]MDB5690462.1 hypothetical protein [Sphingomonas bacterium]
MRYWNSGTLAAIVALGVAGSAAAQSQAPVVKPATAADYTALAALPDWSGVWQPDWSALFSGRGGRNAETPAFTPATKKIVDEFVARQKQGENLQTEMANCVPAGMPQIMRMPYPIEFLFTPSRVTILIETEMQIRRIYTDGRPLPADPDPTFNGSSVGHWEGDTLVVDTIGLNPKTSIVPGVHPTENTKIRETIRLEKPDLMVITTTITDPALFSSPFVQVTPYARHRDWQIREYVCQENNRDAADEFGRPSMSIEQ